MLSIRRDGDKETLTCNGTLTQSQRLLGTRRIRTGLLKSLRTNKMVGWWDADRPIQDGTNYSSTTTPSWSTLSTTMLWRSTRTRTMRNNNSALTEETTSSINNGISSMFKTSRESQRRVNSMKTMASMLKDHSISFPSYPEEDIYRDFQMVDHKKLRLNNQMDMTLRYGTSIKAPWLSRTSNTTLLWTSTAMEIATTWMLEIPKRNGGNSSNMMVLTSSMFQMERFDS